MKKLNLIAFAILINISSSYAAREGNLLEELNALHAEILASVDYQTASNGYSIFHQHVVESYRLGNQNLIDLGLSMRVALDEHLRQLSVQFKEQNEEEYLQTTLNLQNGFQLAVQDIVSTFEIRRANEQAQLQNNLSEINRRHQLRAAQNQAAIDAMLAEFN